MKSIKTYCLLLATLLALLACDEKEKNLVVPIYESFPQTILLADEGDGDLEDEDKFSFKITLADRIDPASKELGGKVVPLAKDVTVNFEVTGHEGFDKLADYIKDWKAFYEIDDCSTSEDENIDLKLAFDPTTGKGSVRFPAGIEEIEIEFETDEDLFDDDAFNTDDRLVALKLTGVDANGQNVVVNTSNEFEYKVLDDEGIYGEWELDVKDATEFSAFKALFGLINEDIKNLKAEEVDEITISFEYGELKAVVVLNETEMVDDCGEMEEENKEIEVEAELEELTDDALEGDVEFVESIEQTDGSEKEFAYSGSFKIVEGLLELSLEGEYDDKTAEATLHLEK